MVFFSRSSLERALTHYVAHYHEERNHQGLQNRLLMCSDGPINLGGRVKRGERLGDLVNAVPTLLGSKGNRGCRSRPRGERTQSRTNDVVHRNFRARIAAEKVLGQFCEFLVAGPSISSLRLADQSQLTARRARFLGDRRAHRNRVYALCRAQHHANPSQVVCGSGGTGAVGSTRLDMIHQLLRGERKRVALADRMAFQEFELRLLGALPLGDLPKGVEVPADQPPERPWLIASAQRARRILEGDFAMLGPSFRMSTEGEGLRFSVQDPLSIADADDGRIPHRPVGLLSCENVCHGRPSGVATSYSRSHNVAMASCKLAEMYRNIAETH